MYGLVKQMCGSEDSIQYKIKFQGKILSVQPRSNVCRYRLDNRMHTLTGYNILLEGTTDENLTADGKVGTGCRMLDKRCWSSKCFTRKWAAMANVTIEYNWGISQKFHFESFCYGPFS